MSHKTIYIEVDEEITSIIDRIADSDADSLTLAAPKGAKLFQSVVNLKFLKREAEALEKKIVLVTSDASAAALAQMAGLAVKKALEIGQDIEPPLERWPEEREHRRGPVKVYDIVAPGGLILKPTPSRQKKAKEEAKAEEVKISILAEIPPKKEEAAPPPSEPKEELPPKEVKERRVRKIEEEFMAGVEEMPTIVSEEISAETEEKKKKFGLLERFKLLSLKTILSKFRFKPPKLFPAKAEAAAPRSLNIFIFFVAVSLVITALSLYFILPSAKVALTLKKGALNFDLAVLIDKNIAQMSADKIPGQLVQVEKSLKKEFSATGAAAAAAQKAKGVITVYNAFGPNPQTLVATTRFLSDDGKLFRLDKTVTIPGAKVENGKITPSSIDVSVTADQAGEGFNIGPSNFTIPGFQGTPKYAGFYGKSKAPMSGGSTKEARVLTKDDLDKANTEIKNELSDQIRKELLSKIPEDLKFIEGAAEEKTSEIVSDFKAGEAAETFALEGKITLSAMLFKESDLNLWVDNNIASRIPAGFALVSGGRTVAYGKPEPDLTKGSMKVVVKIGQEIVGRIDEPALKRLLADKSEEQIKQIILQEPGIEKAAVTFWPFWVSKAPVAINKIKISIQ